MSNSSYSPDWDVYFTFVDNLPAFFSVDLGLADIAPMQDKPDLIEIVIGLQQPDEDGFPGEGEWEVLEEMEDTMVSTLEARLEAQYVAKTLNNGRRALYFYTGETLLLEQLMEEITAQFSSYAIEYQVSEDPEWNIYLEYLYPDEEAMLKINNNRMLQALEEQGDQPHIPRNISHWLYFKSEQDRKACAEALQEEGFTVQSMAETQDVDGMPFELEVYREDKTDEDTITEVTGLLWQLAANYNGDYDGWETIVLQENA
ncbi:DUF695 domain-containing protein [Pontibacter ruber]|uniref:DUF695 domain-containing protein n=1 Tax=Pontibacter ruber TaxID=1343895 RepID=A0ABW5CZ77_9BACT|nr:DUF695 domain-containing protein [Pontibacter ruber]